MRRRSVSKLAYLVAALAFVSVVVPGCGNGSDASPTTSTRSGAATTTAGPSQTDEPATSYAVGELQRTLIDKSRPTPGAPGRPERPERTIETTVLYPADGTPGGEALADATPAEKGAPFPLVVLGHGLGGNVDYLMPLAKEWATAGYVVALPTFPLTHSGTPGGIDGADVQNQPADVSFVIDNMVAASKSSDDALDGVVDGKRIGVAGHSNGGITTLGVASNSCCRDKRVDAAVVLSGTPAPYADGTYDFVNIPPIMFVHGVKDQLVDYNQTVDTFNKANTPKALLTLENADHGDWLAPTDPAFQIAAKATTDFLDGYLRGSPDAIKRLGSDQSGSIATMHFAPDKEADKTVATVPVATTNRNASVSDDTDLQDGQVVTVTWSGFLPGKTVNVLQCVGDGHGGTASCGIAEGHVLIADPTGSGSVDLTIHTGKFATGVCDSQNPCTILVNDSGLLDEDAFRYFPITFSG